MVALHCDAVHRLQRIRRRSAKPGERLAALARTVDDRWMPTEFGKSVTMIAKQASSSFCTAIFFCRCGRCSTRSESREGSPRIRLTLAHSPQSGLLIIRNKKRTEFVYLKRSASGFAFRRMTSKKKVNKQNMLFVERRTRQWWHHCAGEEAVNKFERLRKKVLKIQILNSALPANTRNYENWYMRAVLRSAWPQCA